MSRAAACKNQLRQIGLALHNYHDAHDTFPPGVIRSEQASSRCPPSGSPDEVFGTWTVGVLPFIEHQTIYDEFVHNRPIPSRFDRITAGNRINSGPAFSGTPSIYLCPSDPRITDGIHFTNYIGAMGAASAARRRPSARAAPAGSTSTTAFSS